MCTRGFVLLLGIALFAGCGANPGGSAIGGETGTGGTTSHSGIAGQDGNGGASASGGSAVAGGTSGSTTGNAGSGGTVSATGGAGVGSGGTTGSTADASTGTVQDGGTAIIVDGGGTPQGVLPGSTLIFDGKTLDGWDGSNYWSVKNGAIDGLAQNGGELIVTKTLYDNFRISGQANMIQSENHLGVCFWGAKTGHGYGGCIDFVPPSGSIWDYGGGGGIRTLTYVWKGVKVDKHAWHQFEILANATTGTVRMGVDGHEFPVYHKAGRGKLAVIGLQIHAGFSEVAYKDLAVEVNPKDDRLLSVTDPPLPAP